MSVSHTHSEVEHLSQLSTRWSLLREAHGDDADRIGAAQVRILERYTGPIYRYILKCVGDREIANDLFQDFSLRLVRGDLRRAEPGKGRFRAYLKTVLYHLI